jgi:hypothetical protein
LVGQSLSASETLISQNRAFELGFFKPGTSVNIYLGIWYKNFANKMIVWVANRESPSNDPASSKLELSADGNLVLLMNFTKTVWSTALASSMSNASTAEAVLLDDGNFVVRDGSNPPTIYWQSFDYPTDTWLPGGKLGINKHTGQVQRLISWKNSEDPAPGMFSIGIDPNGSSQLFIEWNRSHRYWSSGDWNGEIFALVPEMRLNNILKFSHVSNENESYFTYSLYNTSTLSRTAIDVSGQIKQLTSLEGVLNWTMFWSQPRDQAEVYGLCGVFGVFQGNSSSSCECLKGFKPLVQNDWSSGCVRKSPLQCQNKRSVGKEDGFLKIVRTMDTTYLHIGVILSTLGLSPHGFALGLYPKGLTPMEIFVHPYIPMILPTSSQCGTLVVYPTILPSNKGPPRLPSNQSFIRPLSNNQDSSFSTSPCWGQDTSMKHPDSTT